MTHKAAATETRVITLPFDEAKGEFDDRALQEWLQDRRLLERTDHLFQQGGRTWLLLILTAEPLRGGEKPASAPHASETTTDSHDANAAGDTQSVEEKEADRKKPFVVSQFLADEEMGLYERLRTWRSEVSQLKQLAQYMVLSNRTLAHIAKEKPRTPLQLQEIHGMGPKKVQQYGEAVLKQVHRYLEETKERPF